jgi:hypothetical protein
MKYVVETQDWYVYGSKNAEMEDSGKWRRTIPPRAEWMEEYCFAIVDPDYNLLFGIRKDNGEVFYNKGMSTEVRNRLDELSGYRIMNNDQYIFCVADKDENILFGILYNGQAVAHGLIEVVTMSEYCSIPHLKGALYIITGSDNMVLGTYINDMTVNGGEAYSYFLDGNELRYEGLSTTLPKLTVEENVLMVEYPSNYTGPMFQMEDGMLFVI